MRSQFDENSSSESYGNADYPVSEETSGSEEMYTEARKRSRHVKEVDSDGNSEAEYDVDTESSEEESEEMSDNSSMSNSSQDDVDEGYSAGIDDDNDSGIKKRKRQYSQIYDEDCDADAYYENISTGQAMAIAHQNDYERLDEDEIEQIGTWLKGDARNNVIRKLLKEYIKNDETGFPFHFLYTIFTENDYENNKVICDKAIKKALHNNEKEYLSELFAMGIKKSPYIIEAIKRQSITYLELIDFDFDDESKDDDFIEALVDEDSPLKIIEYFLKKFFTITATRLLSIIIDDDSQEHLLDTIFDHANEAKCVPLLDHLYDENKNKNLLYKFFARFNIIELIEEIQYEGNLTETLAWINESAIEYQLQDDQTLGKDECLFHSSVAIKVDSVSQLKLLKITTLLELEQLDDDLVVSILIRSPKIIQYLFENDFEATKESLLNIIIENDNYKHAIKYICDALELDNIVNCMMDLHAKKNIDLMFDFIKHVEAHLVIAFLEKNRKKYQNDFINTTLAQAKVFAISGSSSDNDIQSITDKFDALSFKKEYLIFPAKYNGDARLKFLREAIASNTQLSEEKRAGANLIGVVLSTYNRYFIPMPTHQFDEKQSEGYYRLLSKHPFSSEIGRDTVRYEGNPDIPEVKLNSDDYRGANSSTGFAISPFEALNSRLNVPVDRSSNSATPMISSNTSHDCLYNVILNYKLTVCKQIAADVPSSALQSIRVGCYHDYPAIMIYVENQFAINERENRKAWVNYIASFFIALVNHKAKIQNLNIELIRRASFGFMIPTVSICKYNIRISIGLIPSTYGKLISESLIELNAILGLVKKNDLNLDYSLPTEHVFNTNEYRQYRDISESKIETILDFLTVKVERPPGGTAIVNIVRSSIGRDLIMKYTYSQLCEITDSTNIAKANILLNSLRYSISLITLKKNKLSFNQNSPIAISAYHSADRQLENEEKYFECLTKFIEKVESETKSKTTSYTPLLKLEHIKIQEAKHIIQLKSNAPIYPIIEFLHSLLYCRVLCSTEAPVSDFFGSDSEYEDQENNEPKLYAKKIIVENGMRAILGGLYAAYLFLKPGSNNHSISSHDRSIKIALENVYFESKNVIEKIKHKYTIVNDLKEADVVMHDANACSITGIAHPPININQLENTKILIIDTTSASIKRYRSWTNKFLKLKNASILLFVASGFKNEAAGADLNPYGTVRIISKNKTDRDTIYNFIKTKEKQILSNPSHQDRQMKKRLTLVPQNSTIFNHLSDDEEKQRIPINSRHSLFYRSSLYNQPAVEVPIFHTIELSPLDY